MKIWSVWHTFITLALIAAIYVWLTTDIGLWPVFAVGAVSVVGNIIAYRRHFWHGAKADRRALIFVDGWMGVRPTVLKNALPDGYRLACLFFGAGLIDRTRTLDHGFAYKVLDEIPRHPRDGLNMDELCEARGRRIVSDAQRNNQPIHLLWSGGIDSTAAAVSLVEALRDADDLKRLTIYYSPASRKEYPWFFQHQIKGQIARKKIIGVAPAFEKNALVVTGEHGDQLFGSATALGLDRAFLAQPWQTALPRLLSQRLASSHRAQAVTDYLSPQIERAPVPIPSLYECLWWLNFSCKWQSVSVRMIASSRAGAYSELRPRLRHFFQNDDFQSWALTNPDKRIRDTWESYKWPLRDYIHAFTGDDSYRDTKLKEPSLKGMLARKVRSSALALGPDGGALWQHRDLTLKKALPGDSGLGAEIDDSDDSETGISFEFSAERESDLWDGMGDGGE